LALAAAVDPVAAVAVVPPQPVQRNVNGRNAANRGSVEDCLCM
jgi:hypothetical protein